MESLALRLMFRGVFCTCNVNFGTLRTIGRGCWSSRTAPLVDFVPNLTSERYGTLLVNRGDQIDSESGIAGGCQQSTENTPSGCVVLDNTEESESELYDGVSGASTDVSRGVLHL